MAAARAAPPASSRRFPQPGPSPLSPSSVTSLRGILSQTCQPFVGYPLGAAAWLMVYPPSFHPYFALFYQIDPGTNQSLTAPFRGDMQKPPSSTIVGQK